MTIPLSYIFRLEYYLSNININAYAFITKYRYRVNVYPIIYMSCKGIGIYSSDITNVAVKSIPTALHVLGFLLPSGDIVNLYHDWFYVDIDLSGS